MVTIINGYSNVFFDDSSDYDFSEVNERKYVLKFITLLKTEFNEKFEQFQFYFLFSHNNKILPNSAKIKNDKKILFWFSDESCDFPKHITKDYYKIFKSYITLENGNVFTNHLGYVNEYDDFVCKNQKDIEMFFSGNLNTNRLKYFKLLLQKKYKILAIINNDYFYYKLFTFVKKITFANKKIVFYFTNGFKKGFQYNQYIDYISRSNIVFCPRGFNSPETFRHYEGLANNCIIVSEHLPDTSLYLNNPFVIIKDEKELGIIIDKIIRNELNMDRLCYDHREYYRDVYSIESFVVRVFKICSEDIVLE